MGVGVVMASCNKVVMVMMLKSISNLAMEEEGENLVEVTSLFINKRM